MRSADFVEMTTTSIAASGAGAVTCTQIANTPTFTIALGSAAATIRYVIEDTVNKKWEVGIGSVAANVLTRTRPQVTWDGTTLDDSTPTALTFTGSPTSGDIKIRLAPTAESSPASMPALQTVITGDSTWGSYPWSRIEYQGGNGATLTLTADRECYLAYHLPHAGLLTGAQFKVDTAVASSNLKWALYAIGYDGMPGQKIVDFVTTATTTTGVKTDTATGSWTPAQPVWLTPGWYSIGFISGHAIGIACGGSDSIIQMSPWGRKDAYGYPSYIYVAGSYSTGLPAIPSLGSGSSNSQGTKRLPWIGLRVVA